MFVHSLLSESALRGPKNVAIASEAGRFSFSEVEHLSDLVASTLISLGIKKGDRVVVYMDNCLEAVVSIFGILKAGGIFIPVNSHVKAQKFSYILDDDSGATVLITSSSKLNFVHKASQGIILSDQYWLTILIYTSFFNQRVDYINKSAKCV